MRANGNETGTPDPRKQRIKGSKRALITTEKEGKARR